MRWHLVIKELSPELKYIKGENNVVADALSHLEMSDNQEILNISELYGYNEKDLPDSAYPIHYHDIAKAQETDQKNLTYNFFNTEHVMRWRLILEEFGPELKYIKGENNAVSDSQSLSILERWTAPNRITPQLIKNFFP